MFLNKALLGALLNILEGFDWWSSVAFYEPFNNIVPYKLTNLDAI